MSSSLPQRLVAAGALCVLALVGLVISEGRARDAGAEVVLDMQPVDPRSLLTGHYVMLSFSQALHQGETCPPVDADASTFHRRPESWVVLVKRGDRHVVSAVHRLRPAPAAGKIVVRGEVSCDEPSPPADNDPSTARDGAVRLRLAIDRFHIDQKQAVAIENAVRDRTSGEARVAAIVSVGADGTPRTKGLEVDGRRIELSWL